ncbi:ATP-binding protein [Halopiger thermotolerans]
MTEYEYWTDFVRESTERITELNNALLTLERNPDDEAAVEDVFRVAHTLKGNCGAAGLESASELAHAIEDLLDAVRGGALEVSPEVMDDVFDAVDELETIIETADGADDVDADPSETIHALRDHLEGPAAIQPPSDDEIEDVLSRFEPPAEDRNVYLARLSVDEDEADGDNAGILIVKALIDAFDLIGTDPPRDAIDAHAYNGRFDAVFASAVTESAIESGLEPVDEVADFELLEVTDRFAAVADAGAAGGDDGGDGDAGDDATPADADISADEAQDLEVDELLGEFDQYDDLDSMVEEVEDDDDLDAFDDMGKAGSFDDLLGDDEVDIDVDPVLDEDASEPAASDADDSAGESAAATATDSSGERDEGSESASDSGSDSESAVADPASAEDSVEDADAVFQELKDEVEMVGFDELQDELAELEFDEFDTDDEVSMDELLGDDVADGAEDPFLESDGTDGATAEADDATADADLAVDGAEPTADQPSDGDVADAVGAVEATDAVETADEAESGLESPVDDRDSADEPAETVVDDATETMESAETPESAPEPESESEPEPTTAAPSVGAEPADDAAEDGVIPLESPSASAANDEDDDLEDADSGDEVGTDDDGGSGDDAPTAVADFDSATGGFEPATDDFEPATDDESDDAAAAADGADSTAGSAGGDEMVDFSDLGATVGSAADADETATADSAAADDIDDDVTVGSDDRTEADPEPDETERVGSASADEAVEDESDLETGTEPSTPSGTADEAFEAAFSAVDSDEDEGETVAADDDELDVDLATDDASTASTDDAELESEADSAGAFDDGAIDSDEFDVSDSVTSAGDADEFGEDSFAEPDVSNTDTDIGADDFPDENFADDDFETDDAFAIVDPDIEVSHEDDIDSGALDSPDVDSADLDDSLDALEFDPDSDASFEDTFGDDAFTDLDSESASFGESDVENGPEIGTETETDDGAAFERDSFGDDASSGATGADETPDRIVDVPGIEIPDVTVPEPETQQDGDDGPDEIQSLRVDVEQVDELLTLVEGLVTSRVRLRHAVEADEDRKALETELDALEDLTTDLQETVMDVRLVPLETVTGRLPRVVRDIAREQDKEVAFEMDGGDVELDRTILDRISDPLIHLVRNAVDHGIEPPEDREDAEKPREGTVEVTATRERDRVTITVEDDGGGLNPDRIRSEAVEADVLTEAEAEAMADEEVYDLVFHPGLSTAEEVTDVSGRGVGMDVVDRTVTELDGTVSIDSAPGEGTTVTMTLPVSIAIDDVLFVESGGEEFGLPTEVVHDVEPADSIEMIDGEPVLPRDDADPIPVIGLNETLETTAVDGDGDADGAAGAAAAVDGDGGDGGDGGSDDGIAGTAGGDVLVRIRDDVRPVAIRCDRVHGQQEVVVKPFEGFMRGIPGLSGATVRGRGKVVNILDVTTL